MKKIISFLAGILIFSGLPLIGWGLYDLNGFAQNPWRLAYVIMMAVFTFLVVIFVPKGGRSQGEGKQLVKRQKISLLFLQFIPVWVIVGAPFLDRRDLAVLQESDGIRLAGLISAFLGFILMNWSIMVLGKQFSVDVTIQEDHKLVTRGPYSIIRHPRYSGIILFFTGISLVFRSWASLIIVVILIAVLLWRIRDEETLMEMEFKEDWEEYRKRTFSLIPFIW